MWGCGLKLSSCMHTRTCQNVTPYVGVWIEIQDKPCHAVAELVTPYVGVWIEINGYLHSTGR